MNKVFVCCKDKNIKVHFVSSLRFIHLQSEYKTTVGFIDLI